MMPKRNRRLPNKEKNSQNYKSDPTESEKRAKQKREIVENYFLDLLSSSSAEIKKTFKELKKYPMMVRAVYLGHEGAVDILTEIGDAVNVQIADGSSPLIMAIEHGHIHLVSKLLNAGADPTIVRKDGSNALMMAVAKSDISSFNLLWRSLEKTGGYDLNHTDKFGNTLLALAVENGWETGINFLLSQDGIDINHRNMKGQTALMSSCIRGQLKVAEKLVQCGTDPLLEDRNGATAVCHAFVHGHLETAMNVFRRMETERRNRYIERRVELLSAPVASHHQQSSFLQNVLFRVLLEIRRNIEEGVSILCQSDIFGKLVACAEKQNRDTKLLWALYHLCACLIHDRADYSKYISRDMAEQFLQAKGPKSVVDTLNFHSDDFQVKGAALLSIQAITEIESGIRWLQSNYESLVPHVVEFNNRLSTLNYWQEGERIKVLVIWERFKSIFQNICSETKNFNSEELRFQSMLKNEREESPLSGRRPKNKQITLKMMEKQSEMRRSQIIFDPDTKHNFGPCDQVSDEEGSTFEVVTHNKRGKMNSRPKKNRFLITTKREKNCKGKTVNRSRRNAVLESHAVKRQGDDFPTVSASGSEVKPSHHSEWMASPRSYAGALLTPKTQAGTLFITTKQTESQVYTTSGNNEIRSSPRTYAGALRGKSPKEKNTKQANNYGWDTGNLPDTNIQVDDDGIWEGCSEVRDDLSSFSDLSLSTFPYLSQASKPSNVEISHHSDLDEIASLKGERDDPDGRSYASTVQEDSKVKFNDGWLSSKEEKNRQAYSSILIDVLTKMMRMLMKKTDDTLQDSEHESEFNGDKNRQNSSERWRNLIHKMAAEPARNRIRISSSAYYVEKKQFVLNVRDFCTYIGLTSGNQEVIVKKKCSVDYEKLMETAHRLKKEFVCHENVLSLMDVIRPTVIGPVYTVAELCEYNLQEYLFLLKDKDLLPYVGKELVGQLLEGLSYLHERTQPILHGRLKPKNVLVNVKGRLLLSDFGLLDIFPPRCGILDDSLTGTSKITWRSWRPKECLVALTSSIARTVYTSSSDIQVAGMLVHFILSGGVHPYGTNDVECQTNIARARPIYQDMGREADDLITSMLTHDRISRPVASTALKHPFFWYPSRRLDFLITVASQPEMEYRSCDIVKTSVENACTETKNWMFKIHSRILQDAYFNNLTEKTTSDLLRLILNCVARYSTLPLDIQEILNSPALYFTELFPTLVMTIYEVLRQSHWKYRPDLSDYFS